MSVTKNQLIRRVLEVLGVVGAGQTVSAEESVNIEETLRAVLASLDARGIVSLLAHLEADDIPEEIVLPLSAIVARHAAASFGFGGDELAALKIMADEAEQDIMSVRQTERGVEPSYASYF